MSQHHALIKNDPRYLAARLEAFERDGHACVDCEGTEDLQADHLIELAELVANDDLELAWDVDNLATRCGDCNRKRHHDTTDKRVIRIQWVSEHYPELAEVIG